MQYSCFSLESFTALLTDECMLRLSTEECDYIEVMHGACHFPVIFDNSRIIISDSHFECMITDTHNTFYNSKIILLELRNELRYK